MSKVWLLCGAAEMPESMLCLSRGFPQSREVFSFLVAQLWDLFWTWCDCTILLCLLLLCWRWTYQLLNISVVVSSQPSQHRDYLELARPALFFSHPMALGGHQDQNEYSCKSPAAAAALLYSNGYCWGCCYGCRKRVEIQVQKSLLLTATFLIMERCSTTSWTTMK